MEECRGRKSRKGAGSAARSAGDRGVWDPDSRRPPSDLSSNTTAHHPNRHPPHPPAHPLSSTRLAPAEGGHLARNPQTALTSALRAGRARNAPAYPLRRADRPAHQPPSHHHCGRASGTRPPPTLKLAASLFATARMRRERAYGLPAKRNPKSSATSSESNPHHPNPSCAFRNLQGPARRGRKSQIEDLSIDQNTVALTPPAADLSSSPHAMHLCPCRDPPT